MTINGADKSNSIIADIDFLLWSDSSTFNDSYSLIDRIRNVNLALDDVVANLYRADPLFKWDDTTNQDLPIATADLVEGQNTITLLDSMQVIHRLRIKNQAGSFYTLKPVDRLELTDDELNDTSDPIKYYKIGPVIYFVPTPSYGSSGGVELTFQRGANHFSTADTETSPGFNPQYHSFLSVSAAVRYALANDMTEKIQTLTTERERIRQSIKDFYALRSPDLRPQLKLKPRNIRSFGLID